MAWDLSYITKQVEEQAVEHVKAIAADIAEGIRATTPIDTSRLISNNNFSTIAPDYNFEVSIHAPVWGATTHHF